MKITENQANVDPKGIAEEILGPIQWETEEEKGYCRCPGAHHHSTKAGDRDCIVYLNGAATIHCLHESCREEVKFATLRLRDAIRSGVSVDPHHEPSKEELKRQAEARLRLILRETRARSALPLILEKFRWTYEEIKANSVSVVPENPVDHWREVITLFQPGDRIWNGEIFQSGKAEYMARFKTREEWLASRDICGPFTCPAVFKDNTFSRSNEQVHSRRFLVVESDILTKDEIGAVFKWLRDEVGLNLRAVVDTAGKSLHGWFDFPRRDVFEQLKIILPQLGCDPGLFRESQPCRMPAAKRDGNYQYLVYLDHTTKAGVARLPASSLPIPEMYYDGAGQVYWRKTVHGSWQKISESSLELELTAQGYHPKEGPIVSEVKEAKRKIQLEQDIAFAGPLAGFSTGVHTIENQRILVTTSPRIITPVEGEWPILAEFFKGLLVDGDIDQRPYFYGWLKLAYESLASGNFIPGQALGLFGPPNCGKSLLQTINTEVLGGRSAKPYQFMTQGTGFNADLFGAEHLIIEDEIASYDIRARRNLGAAIKNITVNVKQRCHQKGRTPLTLTPFWRLSISANDEPENLMILPPMDESLLDKIMLFKVKKASLLMPTGTPGERAKLWEAIMAELPHFIHFLVNLEIPEELRDSRFGIKAFHHPDIIGALTEAQPEERLLQMIDAELFPDIPTIGPLPDGGYGQLPTKPWKGSAMDLEKRLTQETGRFKREAQQLLTYGNACGTYLGRLAKKYPERIGATHVKGKPNWVIEPQPLLHAPIEDGRQQETAA